MGNDNDITRLNIISIQQGMCIPKVTVNRIIRWSLQVNALFVFSHNTAKPLQHISTPDFHDLFPSLKHPSFVINLVAFCLN